MLTEGDYRPLVERALEEDLRDAGDVTSRAIFDTEQTRLHLYSKSRGLLAGVEVFAAVFGAVDERSSVELHRHDGDQLSDGDLVATVSGRTLSLLTAERTAINFIGYLSGIATETRRYVDAAAGSLEVLDTRKTLPGYRALAKYAVKVGGGANHRIGLYDMVLIKDNHIDSAGGIAKAIQAVREAWGTRYRVEVECRSIDDVREALECGVDVIMLDNMDAATMRRCTALRRGAIEFEASGNVTLGRIPEIAETGVDSVSVGALTHSVRSFDFSFRAGDAHGGR